MKKISCIPKSSLYTPSIFLTNRSVFLSLNCIHETLFFIFQSSVGSFCRNKKALRFQGSCAIINDKLFVFPLVVVVYIWAKNFHLCTYIFDYLVFFLKLKKVARKIYCLDCLAFYDHGHEPLGVRSSWIGRRKANFFQVKGFPQIPYFPDWKTNFKG